MSNSHSLRQSHRLPQRPSTELQVSLSAPPKSAVHTLHPCRKVFEMGPVFYFIDLESHRIINCEKQRRGRKALLCVKSFQLRRFAVFQVCLQNNQRQKNKRRSAVKSRKVLLIVKAAAKLCCRRALIILHKNEESRSGSISFGNFHLPLTPHFCSETLSIMLRE